MFTVGFGNGLPARAGARRGTLTGTPGLDQRATRSEYIGRDILAQFHAEQPDRLLGRSYFLELRYQVE